MEPKKSWFGKNGWDQQKAEKYAKDLAHEHGYHCDIIDGYMIYQFCPEGFVWMKWAEHRLVGDCQTNIAGPGFHAAVVHFLELFAAHAELKLLVEDQTGYYEDRDFQKLRREHFYPWFLELMKMVLEKKDVAGEQLVCWPSNYYLPEEEEGMITTHIRRFSIREIYGVVHSGLSMIFAKDFFLWNEEEKDAYYYRNCALVMVNQECYFMPSTRSEEDRVINEGILHMLEEALEHDRRIPFPVREYRQICSLAEHEPVNLEGVSELGGEEIGCRKGLLFRTIGCMQFAVPGHYLYDARERGNTEHYYDGLKQGGHDYYICAIRTTNAAEFQETSFQRDNVERVLEFTSGDAVGKMAVYRPNAQKDKPYTISAQIIYKNQLTLISVDYADAQEQECVMELVKNVRTIEPSEQK